jgi:hypothetical protein
MAYKYVDRVKEFTTTTGTGNIALGGAQSGYRTFNSALTSGDTCGYCIVDPNTGEWETGTGTFSAPSTLERTTLEASNSASKIAFATGSKDVMLTLTGASIQDISDHGALTVTAHGGLLRIGSSGSEAVAGNDTRLTNARTPTSHTHVVSDITGFAVAALAAAPAETVSTIKTTLGITTLSGSNTGDQNVGTGSTITGETTIYVSQSKTYTVSNFDAFSTYSVSVNAGSASITGDSISFTAPSSAQTVTMTLTTNGTARTISMTILAASVATPTITAPSSGATNQMDTVAVTSSAFSWTGVSDTHEKTDWEVATDSGFTTVVKSSYNDTSNKTSWSATGLSVSTTYYVRCRHKGVGNGWSSWSTGISFATASSFNSYISTPTSTPAAMGDSFEGGFYTGMIWNELVQSSSSVAIGTGSKAFTVTDMTSSPIVYSGQALEVRSRANPANKMIGTVTGASGTTLTINVSSVSGSGTLTDWSIMAQYRIIVAPKSTGESSSKTYKVDNTAAPAACQTLTEGRKATLAMVAAGDATTYPAAHFCNNLNIGSKTDWYLPARDELELCWRNLKPTADNNYVTADRSDSAINYTLLGSIDDVDVAHGHNQNSSPHGDAYMLTVPGQVASGKNFRTGESEAFAYASYYYWSSSEVSATYAWRQSWNSGVPGYQYLGNKYAAFYVRAVRRSII